MNEDIGNTLARLIAEVAIVAVCENISMDTAKAAEASLASLLKSAAIHGFNLVDGESRG